MSRVETQPATATMPAEAQAASGTRLKGSMGVLGLLFTVLAFNAPLTTLAGGLPVVFGFGNGRGAPVTYLVVGALILLFSVGLNAMASRMRQPGAFYCYIAQGLGRPAGLGAGFLAILCYVALGAGSYAFVAVAFNNFLTSVVHVGAGPWWAWALIAWGICTALSMFNIDVSAKVLGVALVLELIVVFAWNLRVLWKGGPAGHAPNPFPGTFSGSPALALVFAGMCLVGFESIQVFREETKDPVRTVPRATYLAVGLITGYYALSAFSYLIAYGPTKSVSAAAADPTGSIMHSIKLYVGSGASDAANLLILTSSTAATLAIQNVNSRYLYALGRDRVLPAILARASAKHGSPVVAASTSGAVMLAAFLVPTLAGANEVTAYVALLGIGSFAMFVLWAGTSAAVVGYFRGEETSDVSKWKTLVAPGLSFLGLAAVTVFASMHLSAIMGGTIASVFAVAFMVAAIVGGIGLALFLRSRDRSVYERIGGQ